MSKIGDEISIARGSIGMSQKQLAEASDFSPQFINDIEHGRRIPAPETVLKICNIFPDVDSAAWLWAMLEDLWGPAIVDVMRRHAVASARPEPREES